MNATENENGTRKKYGAGFQFRKHVDRTKWQKVKRAIYDPDTKEFLGRTRKSWGQLLLFYAIFYAILAAFFAICMAALLATLNEKEPKWTLERSLIGTNPGLGFRPISNKSEEGSLIWYDMKNTTSYARWTTFIDKFLEPYRSSQTGGDFATCNFGMPPSDELACEVKTSDFGDCQPPHYGYDKGSPCIFLKLNKIYGWKPITFKEPLPEMPSYLQTSIRGAKENARDQIWVSCEGEHAYDKDNAQSFKFDPKGFPAYYYPYTHIRNYLSPLVAVQIMNPKKNVLINIECRAWASNIIYIGGDLNRKGSVRFELMIDNLPDAPSYPPPPPPLPKSNVSGPGNATSQSGLL